MMKLIIAVIAIFVCSFARADQRGPYLTLFLTGDVPRYSFSIGDVDALIQGEFEKRDWSTDGLIIGNGDTAHLGPFSWFVGYRLNRYLGFEGGYLYFGKEATEGDKNRMMLAGVERQLVNTRAVALVGTLPMDWLRPHGRECCALRARIGKVYSDVRLEVWSELSGIDRQSEQHTARLSGRYMSVGGELYASDSISIALDFVRMKDMGNSAVMGGDVTFWTFGGTYRW